jgi:amino acid transporter
MHTSPSLKRYLRFPLVTFYGLGTIVGAGIYVLVSEIARTSAGAMPWAFALAGLIATLTGASYAELCTRYPKAAGAVLYVDEAFGRPQLSQAIGILLLLTGIVSAAAICNGFVGYLEVYIDVHHSVAITGLCLLMGAIATVGIKESAWTIGLITLTEVAGLLLVIVIASRGEPVTAPAPVNLPAGPGALFLGAYLAFYAFIGFEDMVNLAEEVVEPERVLPRAILAALGISVLLYIAIAVTALRYIDLGALQDSRSPLALMVANSPTALKLMGVIGMIAITNGALTQIIMSSRVIYGMAARKLLPALFGGVNKTTRTPILNTWLVTALILGFALWLPLVTLAKITSAIMLVIFIVVNLALLRVKSDPGRNQRPHFRVWTWVPLLGLLLNLGLLGYQLKSMF